MSVHMIVAISKSIIIYKKRGRILYSVFVLANAFPASSSEVKLWNTVHNQPTDNYSIATTAHLVTKYLRCDHLYKL